MPDLVAAWAAWTRITEAPTQLWKRSGAPKLNTPLLWPWDDLLIPGIQAIYSLQTSFAMLLWFLNGGLLWLALILEDFRRTLTDTSFKAVIDWVAVNQVSPLLPAVFGLALLLGLLTVIAAPIVRIKIFDFRRGLAIAMLAVALLPIAGTAFQELEAARAGLGSMVYDGVIGRFNLTVPAGGAQDMNKPSKINNQDEGRDDTPNQAIHALDVAAAFLMANRTDIEEVSDHLPVCDGCDQSFTQRYFGRDLSYIETAPPEERWNAVADAGNGITRMLYGVPMAIFGLLESALHLIFTIAFGLLFVALVISILFAFFAPLEGLWMSVLEQAVALFVQSWVISVCEGLLLSGVLSAANNQNAPLVLGLGIFGIILNVVFLKKGLSLVANSFGSLAMRAVGMNGSGQELAQGVDGALNTTATVGIGVQAARVGGAAYGIGYAMAASPSMSRIGQWASAMGVVNETSNFGAGFMYSSNKSRGEPVTYRTPGMLKEVRDFGDKIARDGMTPVEAANKHRRGMGGNGADGGATGGGGSRDDTPPTGGRRRTTHATSATAAGSAAETNVAADTSNGAAETSQSKANLSPGAPPVRQGGTTHGTSKGAATINGSSVVTPDGKIWPSTYAGNRPNVRPSDQELLQPLTALRMNDLPRLQAAFGAATGQIREELGGLTQDERRDGLAAIDTAFGSGSLQAARQSFLGKDGKVHSSSPAIKQVQALLGADHPWQDTPRLQEVIAAALGTSDERRAIATAIGKVVDGPRQRSGVQANQVAQRVGMPSDVFGGRTSAVNSLIQTANQYEVPGNLVSDLVDQVANKPDGKASPETANALRAHLRLHMPPQGAEDTFGQLQRLATRVPDSLRSYQPLVSTAQAQDVQRQAATQTGINTAWAAAQAQTGAPLSDDEVAAVVSDFTPTPPQPSTPRRRSRVYMSTPSPKAAAPVVPSRAPLAATPPFVVQAPPETPIPTPPEARAELPEA